MSASEITDPDRRLRWDEATTGYQAAAEVGWAPDPEEFLARYPDLRAELTLFLSDRSRLDPPAPPLRVETTSPGLPPENEEPSHGMTSDWTPSRPGETTQAGPEQRDGADPGLEAGVRDFGDYELVRVLGRGGMGVVYEARQISLNRSVALKMIRHAAFAGDSDLRRFQNEAEAVATLDHPGVVPIYEVGEYRGHPFFSMKLISGGSLAEHLAGYRDDPRAAADLVADAADAVHHAHTRGILHRDLKPANILLDADGRPHLTDFGLARKVDGESEATASGAILGTPAYMSPEQAEGRRDAITTATDVYGLGAVLYALLTGKAPFVGDSVASTLTMVREHRPEPPRKLNPIVPRDLDVICRKCLEKDPKSRYDSARALADDLRRLLADEPIEARPVGQARRTWMWCRRNPVPACLSAALVAAVVIGFAVVTWKWTEAERQKALLASANAETGRERDEKETKRIEAVAAGQRAIEQAERAAVINRFLIDDLLIQAEPGFNAAENRVTLRQVLDRAALKVGQRFAGRPDLEAELRIAIGQTYHGLGAQAQCAEQFRVVAELERKRLGPEAPGTFEAMSRLAHARDHLGQSREAQPMAEQALDGLRRTRGPLDHSSLTALINLALIREHTGRVPEAMALLREGLAAIPGERNLRFNLALMLAHEGKRGEAEQTLRKILDDDRKRLGDDHPSTITVIGNLALILKQSGQLTEAEKYYREAVSRSLRVMGEEHILTLVGMDNLAGLLEAQGDDAGALELRTRVVAAFDRAYGPDHPDTLQAVNNLGLLHSLKGNKDEAARLLGRAVEGQKRTLGEESIQTLVAMDNLAGHLVQQGKLDDAESIRRKAFEGLRRVYGLGNQDTQIAAHNLVELLASRKRYEDAERISAEAIEGLVKARGYDDPDTQHMLGHRIDFLTRLDRTADAEPLKLRLAAARRAPDEAERLKTSHFQAHDLLKAGRAVEAEPLFRVALDGYRRLQGPDGDLTLDLTSDLASTLVTLGKYAAAEPLQRQAIDGYRSKGNNLRVISELMSLASTLQALKRSPEAQAPIQEALTLQGQTPSSTPQLRASLLIVQGTVLVDLGRAGEAESPLRESLAIRREALPGGHWQIGSAEGQLAEALAALGQFDEAEPLVDSALRTFRASPHAPLHRRLKAIDAAIAVADRRGRPEEAASLRLERLDAVFPIRPIAP